MAPRISLTLSLVALLFMGGHISWAEDDSRLEQINKEVELETARIAEIDKDRVELEQALSVIKTSLGDLRKQDEKLSKELATIGEEKASVERDLAKLAADLVRIRGLSFQRIRALYMNRGSGVAGRILFPHAQALQEVNVARNALFLTKLREMDTGLIAELAKVKEVREKREVELRQLVETQALYRRKITQQQGIAKDRLAKQEILVKKLKEERVRKEAAISSLKAQALRLETVVTSLTGGDEDQEGERDESKAKIGIVDAVIDPFKGVGLSKLKGKLALPVVGKIVRKFGKYKASGFNEMILRKGIELLSEPSSAVKAVAAGRVIFNGTMPGYGTIVIVDHGDRFYTLYGLLSDTKVDKDEVVEEGEKVGLSGSEIVEGRNFYFEIRKNGEPVDPSSYFKLK